ncbi:unnamed protein product [Closterium sp. NIES-54]
MIHAAAPHFLWPFAVQYAAHQIDLQPRISLPETTPTLRWTGKVGDASAFRVWGSRAFVRDTTANKLSSRAVPCVFLGFPPDAPGWQFYHPTSRRVLSFQDVTFDESVSYYRLFPYRTVSPPPPRRSSSHQVDPAKPVEVAVDSGAARGAETGGAEPWGSESAGVAREGTASGGTAPARATSVGALGVPSRREPLSPQRLREWHSRRCRGAAGVGGAGGAAGATGGATGATGGAGAAGGGTGAGAARGAAGAGAAGPPGGAGAAGGGAGAGAAGGAAGAGAAGAPGGAGDAGGGAGAGAAGGAARTGDPGAEGTGSVSAVSGGAARPWPYYVPLLQHPASPLPGPSPYFGRTRGLDSSPTDSDSLRAASPTVTRFLATAVTDPLFESTAASALVTELVDFAAACRLDYTASLVAESEFVCPPSVGGEDALGTDVLEDREEDLECFAPASPHLVSMLLAPEGDPDALDIPDPRSYTEAIEGPYSSQVKRPPGSLPAFKVRYVARGFSQRQGVDYFQTFSPTPKMTTLRVLLHVAAQRDYELHSLDFSTAFLQGSLHEEIWLRRPPGFTRTFPAGTQWSLRRPVYTLCQAPRDLVFATSDTEALAHVKSELQKRHTCTDLGELTSYLGLRIPRDRAQRTITLTQSHMVQQVLQRFCFTYSSPQSTPLTTSHLLSAPPSDESVEPSGPYPELVGYLITSGMGLVLGGRTRVVLTGYADASWVDDLATQRSSQGYTFSLGSGSVSLRSTRSSSVLSSSCEAEIYAGAMAAQELRWLTYLLTDLGEAPCSPPVLYVDNKAMLALCQEHRLEDRTKYIALRYFLARDLQQCGQVRLAYVASQANNADVFTKALQPCDHQRFCTVLGLVPTVPHLLTS